MNEINEAMLQWGTQRTLEIYYDIIQEFLTGQNYLQDIQDYGYQECVYCHADQYSDWPERHYEECIVVRAKRLPNPHPHSDQGPADRSE